MGLYKYLREAWKKPRQGLGDLYKEKLMQYRREPTTIRLEKPTRLDRARSIGYKAKKGFVIIRQKVGRAKRMRDPMRGGRRPKASRMKVVLNMNYPQIAEKRANVKYPNLEVLGSYEVGRDGQHLWYEVILVDPKSPEIKADKNLSWIASPKHTKRAFRGLTSAGRKSRGLRNKGKGAEKVR